MVAVGREALESSGLRPARQLVDCDGDLHDEHGEQRGEHAKEHEEGRLEQARAQVRRRVHLHEGLGRVHEGEGPPLRAVPRRRLAPVAPVALGAGLRPLAPFRADLEPLIRAGVMQH
eukprot:scaffold6638_cov76-Phaeocystis_antarctica.AAC.5